jgi:large subunit ribosomal protein L11
MQIKLLVEGGEMQPGPALSQKLGPAGINLGQVISKVNDATKDFKGLKVPVELNVDMNTKDFEIQVFSPPTSELLKKELGVEKGSGIQKKMQVGNASIEQIISIAKQKMPNLLSKDLKAAVKSVIGTCTSLGVLVENKPASEAGLDVDQGKYDKEIQEEKTETSPEKKAKLASYLQEIQTQQKKKIQEEEEAAKAEAEAAAAEAPPIEEGAEEKPGEVKEEKPTEAPAPAEEKK